MTTARLHRDALAEQIYNVLKERIVDGELVPGQRLNIDNLAAELEVSNIPIREALARLAAEKLVEQALYKGYTVMPMLTLKRLNQLLDARLVLETYTARIAARCLDEQALRHLHDLIARMETLSMGPSYQESKEYGVCDRDFHRLIVASSDNAVIAELYESLNPHLQLIRLQLYRLYTVPGQIDAGATLDEHRTIVAALETHDPDAVSTAIQAHIEHTRQRLGSTLQRLGMPDGGAAPEQSYL